MATLRVFDSIDMLDFSPTIGETTYADKDVLVVESNNGTTYYFGEFSYPNGNWKGTISAIQVYDIFDDIYYDLRNIDTSTRLATAGFSPEKAVKTVFRGNDAIYGSQVDDRLVGFDGNDKIRGNDGDDILLGRDGDDFLSGGNNNDRLSGGIGNDTLAGGRNQDLLSGGTGKDIFVFSVKCRSTIADFSNGDDIIEIMRGADRFRDLEIVSERDDTIVAFGRFEILLRDVLVDDLDRSDFMFG